jgi:hypothetical protein
MLDGKAKVKTQLVTSRQLTPQLFVSLRHSHARLVPYMGEVREFHLTSSKCSCRIAINRCFYFSEHIGKTPTLPP